MSSIKILLFILLLFLIMVIWKCVGNPLSSEISTSHSPLNVGDVRQLIFRGDSSTTLMSVVGKANRSDGTEVFIEEWKHGTQPATSVYYYLVKDGYFMATELDTTLRDDINKTINAFGEQRLAKSNPEDGETWIHTVGSYDGYFWTSESIGKLSTFCGTFDNVFGFTLFDNPGSSILITYYAKGIGYIATETAFFPGLDFSCSYVRVNGREYGHLWPAKDPTFFPKDKRKFINVMLTQYPFLIGQRLKLE